jgi:hypothetical protein
LSPSARIETLDLLLFENHRRMESGRSDRTSDRTGTIASSGDTLFG